MYQYYSSDSTTVPGNSWVSYALSVTNASILSIGFQNFGDLTSTAASQSFVYGANNAYIQVVNNSSSSIQVVFWTTYVTSTGADVGQAEAEFNGETSFGSLTG